MSSEKDKEDEKIKVSSEEEEYEDDENKVSSDDDYEYEWDEEEKHKFKCIEIYGDYDSNSNIDEYESKKFEIKEYKNNYNINKLYFLSFVDNDIEKIGDVNEKYVEDVLMFLTEDEILDILDYYYLNKDFINYSVKYNSYNRISFKEYMKNLKKDT